MEYTNYFAAAIKNYGSSPSLKAEDFALMMNIVVVEAKMKMIEQLVREYKIGHESEWYSLHSNTMANCRYQLRQLTEGKTPAEVFYKVILKVE